MVGLTGTMLAAWLARSRLGPRGDDPVVRDRWVRTWTTCLLGLYAIRLTVDGAIPASRSGGRMVVSNHRSAIDIGILLSRFGGRMVSRHDLARWPMIGLAARSTGTVFVDRKDPQSGMLAIRAMRRVLDAGDTLCVFPEGTTFAGDLVRPFHPGAFVAAARSGAEVIPVGIAYATGSEAAFFDETFPEHLAKIGAAPPTRVVMSVGEPIATEGARAAKLEALSHAAITSCVARARARVDA
jgi:1-acyl-sn-glycerol-3-phosphate acyltransferase